VTGQRLRKPARPAGRPATATRSDSKALGTRLEALGRFVRAAGPYLPSERLEDSRQVLERATQRLMLSHEHTVVALAGTTGSGKSSLFNALAGRELSPVGVRRPTTGEAYACVWGPAAGAGDLLDWLKVPPANRFSLDPADNGAERGTSDLRGLVLLDLPDCDSIEHDHASEVERLLAMVDVVVWVVDPQKYADQVVHERHLPRFRWHREVTLVALNQADLLMASDLDRLLVDLRRLLVEDGLDGVLAIATSAVDAPAGLFQLQAHLKEIVSGRRTAVQRLSGDVDLAVEGLTGLVGAPSAEDILEREALPELTFGLARVAGVVARTEVVETSYRRRATAVTSWLPLRWLRGLRRQPLQRLPLRAPATGEQPALAATGMSQRAAASLVARAVATRAANGLPVPWPEAVVAAARSRLGDLTQDLDRALDTAELDRSRTPVWWRVIAAAQWLAGGTALLGLAWLLGIWILQWAGVPVGPPTAGGLPVPALVLAAGLLTGALVAVLAVPLVAAAARRARAETTGQLRSAVTEVGRRRVIEPIEAVLHAYREAREAFHTARGAG
jgi:energy-coupling factor transporter ATP-binding protein EcfA2